MKVQTSLHFEEKHPSTFALIKIVTFYIIFHIYSMLLF